MEDTPIVNITIEKCEREDYYKLWFVALAGSQGPIINMPKSLLIELRNKITGILLDDE